MLTSSPSRHCETRNTTPYHKPKTSTNVHTKRNNECGQCGGGEWGVVVKLVMEAGGEWGVVVMPVIQAGIE